MEKLETIKELVATAEAEAAKFEGGNASAGTRARTALMGIIKLAGEVRKDIQGAKNEKKGK